MKQERQRLDKDTRRMQFEHTVILLMGRLDYKSVTADAIAKEAGVSKGLLWRYYDNLDELMQKAGERSFRELELAVVQDIDLNQPVPSLLHDAICRAAKLPQSHYNELSATQQIANNLRVVHGNRVANITQSYQEIYARQSALFKRGQAEGDIKTDLDPDTLARLYQGMVDAMVEQLMQDPQLDPQTYATSVSTILLHGITS